VHSSAVTDSSPDARRGTLLLRSLALLIACLATHSLGRNATHPQQLVPDFVDRRLSLVAVVARRARHSPTVLRPYLPSQAVQGPSVASPYGNHTRPARLKGPAASAVALRTSPCP